jgi:hypothetical protein
LEQAVLQPVSLVIKLSSNGEIIMVLMRIFFKIQDSTTIIFQLLKNEQILIIMVHEIGIIVILLDIYQIMRQILRIEIIGKIVKPILIFGDEEMTLLKIDGDEQVMEQKDNDLVLIDSMSHLPENGIIY